LTVDKGSPTILQGISERAGQTQATMLNGKKNRIQALYTFGKSLNFA